MPSHFHLDSVLLLWACLIHQQHQEWSGKTVHIKDHHANITPLSCEQLYKWQNEVWCWNPRSFVSLTHTMTPGSKLRCWKSPLSLCNHPYEPWHSSLPYVLMPYSIRVHVSFKFPLPSYLPHAVCFPPTNLLFFLYPPYPLPKSQFYFFLAFEMCSLLPILANYNLSQNPKELKVWI